MYRRSHIALLIAVALATMAPGSRVPSANGPVHITGPGEGAPTSAPPITLDSQAPISAKVTSTIVSFNSAPAGGGAPKTMRGRFNLPKAANGKVPAVVYVPGVPSASGASNTFALNEAGIATLEIDMWEAAGLTPSRSNLAQLTDRGQYAYGALKYLSAQAKIDAARIGIEGEALGGGVTLQVATMTGLGAHSDGSYKFAAYLSFSPDCTTLAQSQWGPLSPGPVRMLVADADTDSAADGCRALAAKIGAEITVVPSASLAQQSRSNSAQFFRTAFGMT